MNSTYIEVVCVGGFPFGLSLLNLLYSKATGNFEKALTLLLSCLHDTHFTFLARS